MLFLSLRRTGALLLLTGLAACSSGIKDDPSPAPTPAKGMSWTADGTTQTTTTLQSQQFQSSISIAGTIPATANPLYLSLDFPKAVGTYTFSPTVAASATYVANAGGTSAPYFAGATGSGTVTGAGTIVVMALTATSVQGTFTFTGINANTGNAKSIANGTFNVGL